MCFSKAPSMAPPPPPAAEPAKPMVSAEASSNSPAKQRQLAARGLRIDLAPSDAAAGSGLNVPL